ncbi:MAG TPA: metallophosphoesterase [Prolixibacteraceae bacterium]|nr:metallophosphoesterase [Prolixibacteraceae bacterium]
MILIVSLLILITLIAYSFLGFRAAFKTPTSKLIISYGILLAVFVAGILLIWQRQTSDYGNVSLWLNLLIGMLTAIFLLLLFSVFFFGIEDIARLFVWIFVSLLKPKNRAFPKRNKNVARTLLFIGAITLVLVLYGVLFGFSHYKVHRVVVEHEDIPASFDGFTVAQLSDMHLGTFGSIMQVEKGLEMLQKEHPDLLLFTGDLVNNRSSEAIPYIELLKAIEAPYGKFAVLGNHDYAHYARQLTQIDQEADELKLRDILNSMGFTILENQNTAIQRGNDSIVIAGVENWGIAPFPQYGDLSKALAGVSDSNFVILLSHDPSHWTEQVLGFYAPVNLTLSGHTHGMQLGIETKLFKWSPVKYRYRNWSGMHEQDGKLLYVNRGFGGIGFPGRIGIRPEITIFELSSK